MTSRIKNLIAVAWLALVSVHYFSLFPISDLLSQIRLSNPFAAKPDIFIHLLIAIFIIISAIGLGKALSNTTGQHSAESMLFSSAVGLGSFSLLIFLLGIFSITAKLPYFTILLACAVIFFLRTNLRRRFHFSFSPWLLIILAPITLTLIGALAPPTQFDSLVYHLKLPSEYLQHGKFLAIPFNIFFSFPQNLEMLYQMALSIDGNILANLMHWQFLPLTGLAVFLFAKDFYGRRTAYFSVVLWLFSPLALFVSTGTYVDLGLTFYCFMAFYAYLLFERSGNINCLVLSGIFTGFAAGTKYTALIFVPIFVILLLLRRDKPSDKLKSLLTYMFFSFIILAPWLMKNAFFLKNPVAPWGTQIFEHSLVHPDTARTYLDHIKSHGVPIKDMFSLISLPWLATAYGFNFGGAFDILGPAFLLFTPYLFLYGKIDKIMKVILFVAIFYSVSWFFSGKVLRFLLPVLPFLSLLAGNGLAGIPQNKVFKFLTLSTLAFVLFHNILLFNWVMAGGPDPSAVVFGSKGEKDYLSAKVSYYAAAKDCLNLLPKNSRIAFLGETRSYYCTNECIAPTVFDNNPLIEYSNSSASDDQLKMKFNDEGITHILINETEFSRLSTGRLFSDHGIKLFGGFIKECSTVIYKDKHCVVYQINY